eukprot:g19862.t1
MIDKQETPSTSYKVTYSNCVGFDLSQFEVPEGEREGPQEDVLIFMLWISSEDPATELEYGSSVDIVLGGVDDHEETTVVPYSRNLASSSEEIYDITAMTIGKTERTFLDDDPVTSYPALTVSTTKYVVPERSSQSAMWTGTNWTSSAEASPAAGGDPAAANLTDDDATDDATNDATDDGDSDYAIAVLYLKISQGSYSLTEVDDIEPQILGTLLGSIGGFWELLLLGWAIFFVASRTEKGPGGEPMMHARDFLSPFKRRNNNQQRSKHQVQPGLKSPKGNGEGGEFEEENSAWEADVEEVEYE